MTTKFAVYKTLGLNTTGKPGEGHCQNGFIGIYDNQEEAFAAAIINEAYQFSYDGRYDNAYQFCLTRKFDKLYQYFIEVPADNQECRWFASYNVSKNRVYQTIWFNDVVKNFGGGDSELHYMCLVAEVLSNFDIDKYIENNQHDLIQEPKLEDSE